MLSKGQGRTMGSYYMLLYALAEDGRIDEALGSKVAKWVVFADMEELGIRPTVSIVNMVGDVFQKLGMLDKYEKLKKKYPPPNWEYRYIKGKRVKIQSQNHKGPYYANKEVDQSSNETNSDEESNADETEAREVDEAGESLISSSLP
ncbi:pentatricopeptide repeat-containing protein [Tanacetum coccineum]|uniref:Pentatricopeptide repeat-containing protein n=1 Tax=Tanacetum coccineum TaxID=301880 RepID=A0ABQ5A6N0_9ASTR